METTVNKPSLKELLNQKASPTMSADTPQDVTATLRPVFSLMAQINKIAEATINEATKAIGGDASRKETQQAIQVSVALATSESAKEPWEAAAQAELLKTLREKIAGRTISRNRRGFQGRSEEDMDDLIKGLTVFRTASKTEEIAFCSRELMPPGPSRIGRASHARSRLGELPQEIEEIIYTLVQFRIAAEKNTRPAISIEEAQALKSATVVLQNPRGPEANIPEESKGRALPNALAGEEYLKIVGAIFEKLNPDEKSKTAMNREIELFGSATEDVGTELEALEGIQREEFGAVRKLEAAFEAMDSAVVPTTGKRPETKEEIALAIFQAIRSANPTMGKATSTNLTAQLARDEEWVALFLENGPDAIYEAKGYKNHIVLTEPENALFGQPASVEEYLEEGKGILEAVALVDQAEQLLYTDPLISAITARDRESAIYAARRLLTTDVSAEEIEQRPLLKKISETQALAEKLSQAINKEVGGKERNLAHLPMALREREQRIRVDSALARLVEIIGEPEIQATVENLLTEERENLLQIQSNKSPDENDIRARIHCEEKIATLEALEDVTANFADLEEKNYEHLLTVVSGVAIPQTHRDHALITLCDNKSANGTRVKTKETLDRIENLTGHKGFTAKVRGALGTLRRWKERESTPPVIDKLVLAESICATPVELKRLIGSELQAALKSCLEASPCKDPFVANPKDIGNCNREYLVAKADYGDDPKLLQKLRALHAMTAEIVKSSNGSGWVKGQKMAEAFASKEPDGLRARENAVLQAALASNDPKPALRYLSTWYTAVGNERRLMKGAVLEESWRPERLPLVGAKIQTRIENLLEIADYAKAVANNPEALAEAYIQHSLHERRGGEERWDLRLGRMLAKNSAEIDRSQKEVEDWTAKFNGIFEDFEDDDLTDDEIEKRGATKTVCQRKISQKERELETLLMKGEKLRELQETSHAINGAATPEDLVRALHNGGNDQEAGILNMGNALDKAMALASSPGKLNLPKESTVTAFQIMEGAAVDKSLQRCKDTLTKAQKILLANQPDLEGLDAGENPQAAARALKKAAFQTLKEVEIHLWESGKSVEMAEEELEAFIKENPELISNRKEWVETLKKTQTDLAGAVELAANSPQKKKKAKKKELEPENELVAA